MNRFYCPDLSVNELSEEESHHALQVMRLEVGDKLCVFNGKGREAHAKIVEATRKKVRFEVIHTAQTRLQPYTLRVGQAVTKGKSMDVILQKLTELGVQQIWPILSERSVVHLDEDSTTSKHSKWQHTVLEACKQCGQNYIPEVVSPLAPSDFLQQTASLKCLKLIASLQPEARPLSKVIEENRAERNFNEVLFLIGPEGDFTPAEIGQARAQGFQPVSLGPNILRSETAAIFTASILSYELQKGEAR